MGLFLSTHKFAGGPYVAGFDSGGGRYPPDRYLCIYVRHGSGQPVDPLIREYLRLVLSYEGQQAIASEGLGYLPLNAAGLASESQKLEQI